LNAISTLAASDSAANTSIPYRGLTGIGILSQWVRFNLTPVARGIKQAGETVTGNLQAVSLKKVWTSSGVQW
jgi:hypothetical protein